LRRSLKQPARFSDRNTRYSPLLPPLKRQRTTANPERPALPVSLPITISSHHSRQRTIVYQERSALPEEQSVRATEGAADPQGSGIPWRSGSAGLSPHPHSPLRPFTSAPLNALQPRPITQKKRQAGFPLTCRFDNVLS